MTEKARVRLGAYFLFALLVLTLPVTLAVTHYSAWLRSERVVRTGDTVKTINMGGQASAVEFLQKRDGVSREAAEREIMRLRRESKLKPMDEMSMPVGAQVDFYTVDGTTTPQSAKYDGSAKVVDAKSPMAGAYYEAAADYYKEELKKPELLDRLTLMKKKGYLLVPLAWASFLEGATQAGRDITTAATGQVTQTHIAVVCTRFPAWRDVSPRSDGDTNADDTPHWGIYDDQNQGNYGNTFGDTSEIVYRQNPPVGQQSYVQGRQNYAVTTDADIGFGPGTDLPWPNSYFDSPGGIFTTASGTYGVPRGLPDQWDHTHAAVDPDAARKDTIALQNYFYDMIYNQASNVWSMSNFFYEQTNGRRRLFGERTDVIGWLFSRHQLNRFPYQVGGGNDTFAFPGTPLIRPDTHQDPWYEQDPVASPTNPTYNRIKRATLSPNGLTILFAHPVPAGGWFDINQLTLRAYTRADTDVRTIAPNAHPGVDPGEVEILWGPSSETVQMDPYDARRWTIGNVAGWRFQQVYDSATAPAPVAWTAGLSGDSWRVEYGTMPPIVAGTTNDLDGERVAGLQQRGCGPLQDTLVTAADMKMSSYDTDPPYGKLAANTAYNPSRPYNRLRSLDYYNHAFMGAPNSGYQIEHMYAYGGTSYTDDISGIGVTSSNRADRVPPFDHFNNGPNNQGYFATPNEVNAGNHRAGAYLNDARAIMTDQGLAVPPGSFTFYVAAGPGGQFLNLSSCDRFSLNDSPLVFCHEFFHTMGAWDMYDYDFVVNQTPPIPNPKFHECPSMDPYTVMAQMNGRIDGIHKAGLGYATVQNIQTDTLGVQIPRIEGGLREPVIIKIPGNPYYIKQGVAPADWKEYFLLENRNINSQQGGGAYQRDSGPKGLIIYHVDERGPGKWNLAEGGGIRDDNILMYIVEQADGKYELHFNDKGQWGSAPVGTPSNFINPGGDARLHTDPFGNGTACNLTRFWQFPSFTDQLNDWGQRIMNVATSGSPTSMSHGYTYMERDGGTNFLLVPGTETDSFSRVVRIGTVGDVMTADIYVEPAEVVVTGTSIAPAEVVQGDLNVGMMKLTFNNENDTTKGQRDQSKMSTKDVFIDNLYIRQSGTSSNALDLSAIKLYVDSMNPGVFDAPDPLNPATPHDSLLATGSLQMYQGSNHAVFTNLGYRIPISQSRVVFIAYDIAEEAQTNPLVSVGSEFTDRTKILPRLPGVVQDRVRVDPGPFDPNPAPPAAPISGDDYYNFGGARFPIPSTTSIIRNFADRLVITKNDSGLPSQASQGQAELPMLKLLCETNKDGTTRAGGFIRIQSIEVDEIGSVDALADLSNCRLYRDNGDGSFDYSTDTLLATSSFTLDSTDERANFPNLNLQIDASSPVTLWLAVTVAPGADTTKSVQLSLKYASAGSATPNPDDCFVTLINNPTELAANWDYVETDDDGDTNRTWPINSLSVDIITPNNPPKTPIAPFAPSGGQQISDQTPTMTWSMPDPPDDDLTDELNEMRYELQYADNSGFTSPVTVNIAAAANNRTYTVPAGSELDLDQDYWWRVRAIDPQDATSLWSPVQTFRVVTNRAPNPITGGFSPTGNITTRTPRTTVTPPGPVTWNTTTDPDASDPPDSLRYILQIDDNDDFSSPVVLTNIGTDPGEFAQWDATNRWAVSHPNQNIYDVIGTDNLQWGITYYWHVMAMDGAGLYPTLVGGAPNWSATQSFRPVNDQAPYVPIPDQLIGGAESLSANPVLEWHMPGTPDPDPTDTLGTIYYEVQLKKGDGDFSAGTIIEYETAPGSQQWAVTEDKNAVEVDLDDNSQYFWRVRALDDEDVPSPWTLVQDFWVNTVNDPPDAPDSGFEPVSGATTNTTTPTLSWDNSADPDVDPYDGAFTTGAGATRIVGVTWLVQLSRAADFNPVVYNYTVPARTAAGRTTVTLTTPLTDDTTWYWRVRTIDNDGAQSAAFSPVQTLRVDTEAHAPSTPTGLAPSTGQSVSDTTPRLSWIAATDPDPLDTPDTLRYEVEVAEDVNFAQTPGYFWSATTTLADRTYVDIPASDELTEGTTYYWRVRTFDNDGMRSPWTTPGARFNVVANRPPNQVITGFSPVTGGTVSDRTPVLKWTAAVPPDPDADDTADTMRYTLQVDNNSNFLSPEFNATEAFSGDPLQPEMEVTTTLAVGVTYYWRVMARDQKGLDALEWSPTQNFRVVANQPPATPREPFNPSGGAVETSARPTLEWRMPATPDPNPEDPIGTITYDIEVCDGADFSAGNIAWSATGLTLTPTPGPGGVFLFENDVTTDLDDNGHYWWRVRAVDDEGAQSPWTAGQEFWVNTHNDDPEPPDSGFDPPDGASIINAQPRLSWDPGTDPDPLATAATLRYRVELSSNDFATAPVYVYDIGVAGRTYIDLPSALTDDTDWAWRVYTIDAAGAMSVASAVQHMYLDTDNSPPSVPSSGFNPTGGRNVSDITPTLSWDASTDPDASDLPETLRYVVQLCSSPAFPSPVPVDTYFWTATSAPGVTSVTVPDPNALTNGTTYYWRVLAMDDSSTRSAWSSNQVFIVGDNQPPNAPTGGFVPPNNAAVSDTTPMLGWNPATDPDANHTAAFLRYEVWVDDNSNFASPAFARTTPEGQAFIEVTPALLVGTQYFWQVRTQDPYGAYSAWSPTRAFTIVENSRPFPPEPTFVPSGAREVNSATPTLQWSMPTPPDPNVNDGLDTMRYEVQLNNKVDLANGPYVFTTLTAFGTMEADCTTPLLDDTQYWWRVRARDGQGALSDWSTVQTFWVNLENDAPLAPPSGFDPANGEQVADATPLMTWNYGTDPDPYDTADTLHYVVELSTAENFGTVSYQYTTGDGERQVTATAPLTDLTNWYWRVRTVDRDGAQSPWSATQHFYVDLGNQLPTLTNPQCTPLYGILNLTYQLQVTYTDPENDPAEWVRCTFTNGLVVDMVKADPFDNNARDGMVYTIGVTGNTLGLGAHAHAFSCKAGTRLPALDTDFLPGPIIGVTSTTRFVNAGCGTKTVYEEGELVWVYVSDADENSDPAARDTVQVTVTEQNGDSETVTLTEMADNSGTFLGSVPTTGRAGAVNDGALNSNAGAAGNNIVATYRDPDDGAAPTPDQSVANAQVIDTKAPDAIGVALIAASGPHGRTVSLDWSTYDEALQGDVAGYHVYYREAAFSVTTGITLAMTVPAGTKTCSVSGIVPPGLSPNKDYWFGVAAFDEVPHERVSINSVKCTTRDTSTPTINSQIPSPGATDVALDTPISFILEDPGVGVDQSTLVVTVRQNGNIVAHGVPTFTGDKHSLQVTVTPTEPLRWNAAMSVEVVVRDFDANQLTTSWTFSTVTDVELPTLDEQLPTPDATNVPVTTNIGCSLHDTGSGIDTSSVVMLLNGEDVSAGLTFTPAGGSDVRVLYDPPTLSYNMHYVVSVTAADEAGNTIGPITWAFDTVVDAGTVGADQFNPARDATNVPINTNVALRLSDAQSGIDASSLRMWVHGEEITGSPNLTTVVVPDGSSNPSSIGILYDPPADFPYDTDIQVRVLVTDMVGNQTDLNYKFRTAPEPTYNISGLITRPDGTALAGVTVTAGGQTAETDGYGAYRITGLVAGTYTVTPTRAEYDFTPVSTQVTIGPDDATADFVGRQRTYALRGCVTENGVGLAGVNVACGGQTAQTDASGNYVITDLPNGQYTVAPTLANYHFQPSTRAAQVASANVADINFEAIADTFTVSGTITNNAGAKVEGAQVSCGDRSAITNAAGQYVISGLRAGNYTVTPVKSGYLMEPLTRDITLGPSDATNVDFTAHIEMISDFPAGLNLIGVPGAPTNTNPMEVFDIDPLRNEAVYRYNPALVPPRYIVGQNDPTAEVVQVRAGRGFFCRFAEPTQLRVAGLPTADTATVSIGLSEGWNMIANPRSMPVRLGSFASSVPDAVRPFAFVYDNATGSYLMVSSEASLGATRDSLVGWEGAWVRATSGGVSLMLTPGVASVDKVAKPQQASLNGGWTIPVVARAGNRSDLAAMAGVVPGAGTAHTIENPPTPPETVDVYFTDAAGTRLAHDIRSDLTSQTFDFVVSCEVPDALVTVSLPDLSNVPNDLQVVLVDKQSGKSMYARTMQAYSYRSEGASSQRSFQLVVSPRTIGALHLNATAAQANGNNVALTYTVTKACSVNVRVMNLAGRCIRTLAADKPVQAGVQSELWNLCSSTGTRVPAGIYLLQIEAVTDNGQRVQGMTQVRVTR